MSWIEDPGADMFRQYNLSALGMDEAYLNITSNVDSLLWLYTLSEDCIRCPFRKVLDFAVPRLGQNDIIINTKRQLTLRLRSNGSDDFVSSSEDNETICEVSAPMGEFGVYDLVVENNHCSLFTAKEPVNIYLPIALAVFIYFAIAVLWIIGSKQYESYRRKQKGKDITAVESEIEKPTDKKRLRSLDTFRGIAIVMMMFVHHGSGNYWIFQHATWNGLTFADIIFPWFLWIMGVCMPISMKSSLKKGIPRLTIITGVIRRSVILFTIGLFLNTTNDPPYLETLRIPGVMQRFSFAYLVVGTLVALFTLREHTFPENAKTLQDRILEATRDIWVLSIQWIIVLLITLAHTLTIFLAEVPECPTGYIGPGGIQDNEKYKNCVGGVTGWVDRQILGVDHIYQWPTANEVYNSGPFDPEGVLGSLTTILQVFLGVQAGTTLLQFIYWRPRVVRWLLWASFTGLIGAALCFCSQEDGPIPVNKNLWSLSFVLVTSCFAFILLTILYLLIDVVGIWNGAPFYYPGMNSILIYVIHLVCNTNFPFHWRIGPMRTHGMLLLENLWATSLWVLVAFWLHHVGFFLSI